jgi:predicted ester cyclase
MTTLAHRSRVQYTLAQGGFLMSSEEHKALIRQYIDEVWNRHNLAAVEDFVADPAAARESFTRLHTAYPDLHVTIQDLIAEGDTVAYRWTMRGTHELGIPLTWTGMTFAHIAGGKIVAEWVEVDQLHILHQLGVFPGQVLCANAS